MMHSVDLLNEALQLAANLGFEVRREWLGESVGGACRLGERWILFSDLSLAADQQLVQVVAALKGSPLLPADFSTSLPSISPHLLRLLQSR